MISAMPRVSSDAFALSPSASPSTMPAAMPITFFKAAASSAPAASSLV